MVTLIANKKENCDVEVAKLIRNSIQKLLQTKNSVVLGIVGGRSVSGIFNELKTKNVTWGRVHIFMVDERMVPLTSTDSNFKLLSENLLEELIDRGVLPSENIHPFKVRRGIEEYQKELEKYGGQYDIILLSSGEDGHVGALYPNHHSVKDRSEFFITMDDSPKPPKFRITASLKLLKKSNIIIVLFYGEGKKKAYGKYNDDDISVKECPAKLVNEVKEGYVVTDLE
jgi:6-phosphogluconolactonase